METKQLGTTEQDLALAGELLRQGQLVAFPTETVYGLGADALNETAVAQIYAAKGRPSDNPLIVHVAEKADIAPLVREIPEKAKRLFDRFFPGPLTVILPKSDKIGKVVSGGLDTVAVLDAPQLFESGADALCAYTLAVTAPKDTRLARIMERDGIDRAAAQLRMQAQPAADFYTEKCTFTVTNDGRDIKSQVDRILEAIL